MKPHPEELIAERIIDAMNSEIPKDEFPAPEENEENPDEDD